MYRIAVMGDRDSIYGFAALGLEVFPVSDREEAVRQLHSLTQREYAVIYITEVLAAQLPEELERLAERKLPAIIPIPGVLGNTGMGMLNVKRSVEKAVGSDIIFNDGK